MISLVPTTGNKNLSDILKNVNSMLETESPQNSANINNEKLENLEKEMKKDQMKYESRLKGLKQKYRHLNGKVPVHSYDNRELKQLEENQMLSRYAYYNLKKEVNLEQLLSIIDEMKKLQVVYAELKRGKNNAEEIKQTERKYYEYLLVNVKKFLIIIYSTLIYIRLVEKEVMLIRYRVLGC